MLILTEAINTDLFTPTDTLTRIYICDRTSSILQSDNLHQQTSKATRKGHSLSDHVYSSISKMF